MIRLDKQQVKIICIVVALLIGFGSLGYYPLITKGGDTEEVLARRQQTKVQVEGLSRQLPVLNEQIDKLEEYDLIYEKKVPRNWQAVAQLWGRIGDVMNEHNLSDQVIQPGPEEHGTELTSVTIELKCTGSLEEIFNFFNSLQKFERLVRIESVELKNDSDYTGKVTMSAKAKVYHRSI